MAEKKMTGNPAEHNDVLRIKFELRAFMKRDDVMSFQLIRSATRCAIGVILDHVLGKSSPKTMPWGSYFSAWLE